LAVDGAEAVEAVLSESYDAVLMDVQMPIVDGLEATRRIRALPPPQNVVRVIAVTASALPDQVEACRAAGMDAHLAKPIDRAALLATLGGSEATAAPAPEAAAEALLDAAVLERLAEGLGQVAGEIVGEFVEEVRSAAALLADGATPDGPDFQRLRQAGHRLVGAGRTLGAIRLAAAAERLQSAARHGDAAASEAARQAALAAARETLVPLDAWLRRSGVAQALAAGG
jgi:CheY-like chemotaxis protein